MHPLPRAEWIIVVATIVALVCAFFGGCAVEEPPSTQCKFVWGLRDQIKDMPATSIADAEHKAAILDHAAWCDKYPSGVWL